MILDQLKQIIGTDDSDDFLFMCNDDMVDLVVPHNPGCHGNVVVLWNHKNLVAHVSRHW